MALPNILAKKEICPEFLQSEATVENIVTEMTALLTDQNKVNEMITEFETVRSQLDTDSNSFKLFSLCDFQPTILNSGKSVRSCINGCWILCGAGHTFAGDTFQKNKPPYDYCMSHVVQLGDPLLRQSTQLINDPLSPKTKAMIDQMVMTLKEKGIGIAGPQVGFDQQIFIVAPNQVIKAPYTKLETGLVVMNPKISFLTDDITYEWEGCLSILGFAGMCPASAIL